MLTDFVAYLNKSFEADKRMRFAEWLVSTTDMRDLQTKSSFLFTPQIGTSIIGVRNNNGDVQYIPKLNWGININFRPIDKLISRKYIDNLTLWHYLSWHFGLTIGEFTDKEFENLYSKTSLLTGPSFRINRVLYFSAGVCLLRQKDSNPVVNKFNVRGAGYATLLLDLDITNAVSAIRGILFR